MALGEIQLKPDEFWVLTNGELMAMIRGYVVRRDLDSSNHRSLFTLMRNVHKGKGESTIKPQDAWPLDIDVEFTMGIDERIEFYKKIAKNSKFKA